MSRGAAPLLESLERACASPAHRPWDDKCRDGWTQRPFSFCTPSPLPPPFPSSLHTQAHTHNLAMSLRIAAARTGMRAQRCVRIWEFSWAHPFLLRFSSDVPRGGRPCRPPAGRGAPPQYVQQGANGPERARARARERERKATQGKSSRRKRRARDRRAYLGMQGARGRRKGEAAAKAARAAAPWRAPCSTPGRRRVHSAPRRPAGQRRRAGRNGAVERPGDKGFNVAVPPPLPSFSFSALFFSLSLRVSLRGGVSALQLRASCCVAAPGLRCSPPVLRKRTHMHCVRSSILSPAVLSVAFFFLLFDSLVPVPLLCPSLCACVPPLPPPSLSLPLRTLRSVLQSSSRAPLSPTPTPSPCRSLRLPQ